MYSTLSCRITYIVYIQRSVYRVTTQTRQSANSSLEKTRSQSGLTRSRNLARRQQACLQPRQRMRLMRWPWSDICSAHLPECHHSPVAMRRIDSFDGREVPIEANRGRRAQRASRITTPQAWRDADDEAALIVLRIGALPVGWLVAAEQRLSVRVPEFH